MEKKVINKKEPSSEAANPIMKPYNKSILFIPIPSVELLYGVMCCQVKLNRYY